MLDPATPRREAMSAGILTMAFGPRRYIRMAKGMVRSLRLHGSTIPVAIVTDRSPRSLRRWFDVVIPMNSAYGPGLAQKLHLDAYSPFDRTLFVDSDFLFFHDPGLVWNAYERVGDFVLIGYPMGAGETHYAVEDLSAYMSKLALARMLMTNTGILYFNRSEAAEQVFRLARELALRAEELGLKRHPVGFFNDEPIFASAVELLGLPFLPVGEQLLFELAGLGTEGMMAVDVRQKLSRYVAAGQTHEPALIHFNVGSQASRVYDRELRRLEFGRLLGSGPVPDLVTTVLWKFRGLVRRSKSAIRAAQSRLAQRRSHIGAR